MYPIDIQYITDKKIEKLVPNPLGHKLSPRVDELEVRNAESRSWIVVQTPRPDVKFGHRYFRTTYLQKD